MYKRQGDNDVFSGTLADGTSFIFSSDTSDELSEVNLSVVPLTAADTTPVVISSLNTGDPVNLSSGQTLTVAAGGVTGDNLAAVNATVNIEAGLVGADAETAGSVVNISGGTIEDSFNAFNSEVNVTGCLLYTSPSPRD